MSLLIQAVFYIFLVSFILCTVDLNFKELQYVAGMLKPEECKELAESLHTDKKLFSTKKQKFTGKHEPNKTCMFLLLKYDRTEGRGKTFLDLAIRLRQIGRPDVAESLSKMVYHEKALAIKDNFLDDPYREMIREQSFFLDIEKPKKKIQKVEEGSSFNWNAFWICTSIISVILLTFVGFRICCPHFGTSLWNRLASKGAIDTCNLCGDELSRCWRKFKWNYERYVVGNEDIKPEFDDKELLLKEAELLNVSTTEM